MASTFSTDLALELVATGEKAGLWGTITNTNLQILQQSTTGVVDVAMTSGSDVTLLLSDGATSNGKNIYLKLTGTMTANQRATVTDNFAGMKVMTSTTLASYLTGVGADRAGTVVGTPVATYVAAKDTMTQVIGVTGFQANLLVQAGETITFTNVDRLNLATREAMIDETASQITFTATVTATEQLGASGEGNLTITAPALFEANGQYNSVTAAIAAGSVVTLGGAPVTRIQPNLFWHRDAFVVAGVPQDTLDSTDTRVTTKDGLSLRVSMGSNFTTNTNKVRIDLRYALGTMNPALAGQGFGS